MDIHVQLLNCYVTGTWFYASDDLRKLCPFLNINIVGHFFVINFFPSTLANDIFYDVMGRTSNIKNEKLTS